MKKVISVFFFLLLFFPATIQAQFTEEFIVETEVYGEVAPGGTPGGGGGGQSTRVDRDNDNAPSFIPNVRDIRIIKDGGGIRVSWQNPAVDFTFIRVVRSDFYAKDPYDGWVVYDSRGDYFYDALPDADGMFYTFFVMMPNGEHSSGIATFYAPNPTPAVPPPIFPPTTPGEPVVPPDTSEPPIDSAIDNVLWERFVLLGEQRGLESVLVRDGALNPFSANHDINFAVPVSSLSPETHTVVLALQNKLTGETERFLLRRDGMTLRASVPRRLLPGEYTLSVGFYTISAQLQSSKTFTLTIYPHYFVESTNGAAEDGTVLITDYIYIVYIFTALLLLLFLVRLWVVIKRGG